MDREIRIANAVYAAVTVLFVLGTLGGALILPQSFFA